MLLYTDVLTGDEIVSDAFKLKEIDGIVYEVDCKMIKKSNDNNIDIGANPSAEEAEEALDDSGIETVNDVIDAFKLKSTPFDKKGYLGYLKGYMKAIKAHLQDKNPDRVEAFEKGAAAYAKKVVANFKDFEFYIGESMNVDGMVALLNYREDGITPYLTFWKDGLKEVKL